MTPDFPKTPPDEFEARLTALLLGELSPEETEAVRQAIAQDPSLAQLHERLRQTMDLVRAAVAGPESFQPAIANPSLRLSEDRRKRLFAHFKTTPLPSTARQSRRTRQLWYVPVGIAAMLVGLLAWVGLNPRAVDLPLMERFAWLEAPTAATAPVPVLSESPVLAGQMEGKSVTVAVAPESVPPVEAERETTLNFMADKTEIPPESPANQSSGGAGGAAGARPIANQGLPALAKQNTPAAPAAKPSGTPHEVRLHRELGRQVEGEERAAGAFRWQDQSGPRPEVESRAKLSEIPQRARKPATEPMDQKALSDNTGMIADRLAEVQLQTGNAFVHPAPATTAPATPPSQNGIVLGDAPQLGYLFNKEEAKKKDAPLSAAVPALKEPELGQKQELADAAAGRRFRRQDTKLERERVQEKYDYYRLDQAGRANQEALEERARGVVALTAPSGPAPKIAKGLEEQLGKSVKPGDKVDKLASAPTPAYAIPQARVELEVAAKRVAAIPEPQPEIQARENPFSTFSLNVSDVSFKLAAASLAQGRMPDPSSVRSEEFINAFDYRDPEPAPGLPVGFVWERAQYPFAHNRDLLRLSLRTAARGREPGQPLNLVLLLDNSGSMERADRVKILREALTVLSAQLQAQDRLSVVTFARTPQLRVDGVAGSEAAEALKQVSGLTPEGGTNLESAMDLAYETATRHFQPQGRNRVVLLTDGAANLGNVDPEALKRTVEARRQQGIALDCFGIGWEGYNDDLLETLSRNGDGRYGFLNRPEAVGVEFAAQLAGALQAAAADVKVQVEFNPARVAAYRQIGYAKHQLTKEQFRDNTVDAAELGAAESGNALYVLQVLPDGRGPLATVRARYRVPETGEHREQAWEVPALPSVVPLEAASPAMRLAATAAAFSEWLVASPHAGLVNPDHLLRLLRGVPESLGQDPRPRQLETMIQQAKSISR